MQLEKAHRFLDQADEMCKQHYWDIASNRYYYACYHAVQALLIKNGLYAHTHDGLLSQFGLHFVKTGKIDKDFGAFLEFAPGKEGMIHISKIAKERINHVEDVLTLGDVVKVVCLGKDKMGRFSFSIKDLKE